MISAIKSAGERGKRRRKKNINILIIWCNKMGEIERHDECWLSASACA